MDTLENKSTTALKSLKRRLNRFSRSFPSSLKVQEKDTIIEDWKMPNGVSLASIDRMHAQYVALALCLDDTKRGICIHERKGGFFVPSGPFTETLFLFSWHCFHRSRVCLSFIFPLFDELGNWIIDHLSSLSSFSFANCQVRWQSTKVHKWCKEDLIYLGTQTLSCDTRDHTSWSHFSAQPGAKRRSKFTATMCG